MKLIGWSWVIAILNLFDGLATHYGLKYAVIEEGNPVMAIVWEVSPPLFLAVKTGLSVLIVYVSVTLFHNSGATFRKVYGIVLTGVSCLYGGICFLHLVWIISV